MRRSTLLLLPVVLAAAGCGERETAEYVVIEDFLARSPGLECEVVAGPEYLGVTELRTATDTTVLVVDRPGRRLVELDAGLRPVWELRPPSLGPGAVNEPVSAALLGDTAVVIAEQRGLQLIVFTRSGELIRSAPLTFAPSAVAGWPAGEVLVTAMSFGGTAGTLAYRYDGATFHPLDVPPRVYDDMLAAGLGNSTLAEALADGGALVVHQFMSPRGFRLGAGDRVDGVAVPTPDATRDRIGFAPASPMTEDQMARMLVPASAMTVDRGRGEIYLLTRTGRLLDGRPERALLRLDERLGLLESRILGFHARRMAVLPRAGILLLVDDEDRFHACDFRHANGHAGAR